MVLPFDCFHLGEMCVGVYACRCVRVCVCVCFCVWEKECVCVVRARGLRGGAMAPPFHCFHLGKICVFVRMCVCCAFERERECVCG